MTKNSVTNSKFLADIVRDRRSRAYKNLLKICWDNDAQSDASAPRLSEELKLVLIELLKGDSTAANQKLADHGTKPGLTVIRQGLAAKRSYLNSDVKEVRIGQNKAWVETIFPNDATPEELVYGVLRRALNSGDIKHLELCQTCGKLFYRKSLKGKFCSNDCRWTSFNHRDGREDEAHERYVKKKKKLLGAKTTVARRPRKRPPLN